MTIHRHTAADGTNTYRGHKNRIVALAGSAEAVLTLSREFHDFQLYGHPEARRGLFLLARPGLCLGNLTDEDGAPLLPSTEAWLPMAAADVEEFTL